MTLGSTPQPSDVVAELRKSLPYTFPDAASRWLAGVGSSASITFPNNFANKQAVKIVDQTFDSNSAASSYTFSASFGADYPGRTIIAVVLLHSTANAILNQTSVTIGGSSASGDDTGETTTSGGAAGCGIWAAQPSGTSGNIVVNYDNGGFGAPYIANGCYVYVISVAGLASVSAHDTLKLNGGGSGGSSGGGYIAIPANGILIAGLVREDGSALSWSGATERDDRSFDTTARVSVAFDNRLSVDSNRHMTWASTGTSPYALFAASFT